MNRGAGVSREPLHSGAALAVVSRGFGTQDQSWAAPVMPAEAVHLLALIKSSRNHMGASRYFVFFFCWSESFVCFQAGAHQAADFSRPGPVAGGFGAGRAHLHHLRPGSLYGHWCIDWTFPCYWNSWKFESGTYNAGVYSINVAGLLSEIFGFDIFPSWITLREFMCGVGPV